MSTATLPIPAPAPAPPLPRWATIADLLRDLGDIPPERVRMIPTPGTATEADLLDLDDKHNIICELVDGVLVEKPIGLPESILANVLTHFVEMVLDDHNLGFTAGEAGFIRLGTRLVRAPDFAFYRWDRLPDRRRPPGQIPPISPDLAVEILSPSNPRAEMARKRGEYFASGTTLVWQLDPKTRKVEVYTAPDAFTVIGEDGTLDGGTVLPGFTLGVRRWFERANRSG
jgi:Uma2 family endonuclease